MTEFAKPGEVYEVGLDLFQLRCQAMSSIFDGRDLGMASVLDACQEEGRIWHHFTWCAKPPLPGRRDSLEPRCPQGAFRPSRGATRPGRARQSGCVAWQECRATVVVSDSCLCSAPPEA